MQALGSAENGGECLNGRANDIYFGLLRGERRAGGLRVKTKHQRARIFGMKTVFHYSCPQAASRTKLGDLFQQVVMRIEEERKPRCKFIDVEANADRRFDVTNTVSERERQLLCGGRTGFANVITRDRDGIPIGHLCRAIRERVGDQPERGLWRIYVSAAGDVFFQDVVLDRAAHLVERNVLLSGNGEIKAKQR